MDRTIAENRKALFRYYVLEKFQAGIVLNGQEVKSIKTGRISLAGSFVVVRDQELFLIGANVPAYQPKNAAAGYNPERSRKLLLKKQEIAKLIGKAQRKGLTMAALKVYTKHGKIKVEFAVVKSKNKFDKREVIKKREADKEIQRALKRKTQ